MHLSPLGSTAIWYCVSQDWDMLCAKYDSWWESDNLLQQLLAKLFQDCSLYEKSLLQKIKGTTKGPHLATEHAFRLLHDNTTKTNPKWLQSFMVFQVLDCLLWHYTCIHTYGPCPSATQQPLHRAVAINPDTQKYHHAWVDRKKFLDASNFTAVMTADAIRSKNQQLQTAVSFPLFILTLADCI